VGIKDPGFWFAVAMLGGAVFRPAQNIIIFLVAIHGAKPCERREIIEALAKTKQFGLWSKPQWMQLRKPSQDPPAIEQIDPEPAEDEAA